MFTEEVCLPFSKTRFSKVFLKSVLILYLSKALSNKYDLLRDNSHQTESKWIPTLFALFVFPLKSPEEECLWGIFIAMTAMHLPLHMAENNRGFAVQCTVQFIIQCRVQCTQECTLQCTVQCNVQYTLLCTLYSVLFLGQFY